MFHMILSLKTLEGEELVDWWFDSFRFECARPREARDVVGEPRRTRHNTGSLPPESCARC